MNCLGDRGKIFGSFNVELGKRVFPRVIGFSDRAKNAILMEAFSKGAIFYISRFFGLRLGGMERSVNDLMWVVLNVERKWNGHVWKRVLRDL